MRLTHVTIKNMRGLAHFDGDIPAVCLVSGANGQGKSTLEDAIKYTAGRRSSTAGSARGVEHDPTMLHGDAERGECVLTFDDPEGNLHSLKCVITRGTDESPGVTQRYTKAADSTKYVKAGSDLDQFFNALGYDPFKLKVMEPKERIEHLLRILPQTVTVDEIKQAIAGVVQCEPRPTVDAIQALHDDLFAKRTDINRDADTLAKQAELLNAAPGVGDGEDWVATLGNLRMEKQALDEAENAKITEVGNHLNKIKAQAAEHRRLADIAADKVIDARIQAAQADRASAKADSFAFMNAAIEAARTEANKIAQEFIAANQPQHDAVVSAIATAETRARVQIEAEGTRKAAEQTAQQAIAAQQRSAQLTQAIENLRNLKTLVSKRMDLDGAVIASPRRGMPVDLCREQAGALVPFTAWNDADKDRMALRLALKSQGKCALVIIDSIGNFDDAAREQLKETCKWYAETAGVSFIVGHATGGPLSVGEWA